MKTAHREWVHATTLQHGDRLKLQIDLRSVKYPLLSLFGFFCRLPLLLLLLSSWFCVIIASTVLIGFRRALRCVAQFQANQRRRRRHYLPLTVCVQVQLKSASFVFGWCCCFFSDIEPHTNIVLFAAADTALAHYLCCFCVIDAVLSAGRGA